MAVTMTVDDALEACGVRPDTLTSEEQESLLRDGYLVLPDLLTPAQVDAMAACIDEQVALDRAKSGKPYAGGWEEGVDLLQNMVDRDPMFDICYTHPRVLAAVALVLENDLKIYSLNARKSHPGYGDQPFHADWLLPREDTSRHFLCNSMWMIDDFTEENGSTVVIPGSHRGTPAPDAPHVSLVGSRGSVGVFIADTAHRGTLNRSNAPRRGMTCSFVRRDQPQQCDQRANLRPETVARLSDVQRFILDV